MKKKILILFLLVSCLMVIGNVHAETKEELERLLSEKFPNDTYNVNAISPKDYISNYENNNKEYSNFVENQLLPFEINGNIFNLKIEDQKNVISEDYSKATFIYKSETVEVTKELNLKWAEFNNEYEKKVNEYLNKVNKTILTDLDYVNYKIENYKNLYIPNLENVKEEHITYKEEIANKGCYYDEGDYLNPTVEKACSIIMIMYDNILYKVLEPNEHETMDKNDKILKLYSYEVVYIPSDTKEDKKSYLEQAKKRIDDNLKLNVKIEEDIIGDTLPNKEELQNYLKTQLEYGYKNNYIDKELNKFEPVFAKATIEDDYTINFIIAKGTNEQLGIINNVGEKCSEKDGLYFDKNGNSVSKEAYYESCGVVENPQTGNELPLALLIISIILGFHILLRNKNYFKKI